MMITYCYACHSRSREAQASDAVLFQDTTKIEGQIVQNDMSDAVDSVPLIDTTMGGVPYSGLVPRGDQEPQYYTRVNFNKFPVKVSSGSKATIDWKSNPNAFRFKTRIVTAYRKDIDFAGHYVGCVFGCGAGCVLGFMVDTRDGKIYDLPLGEENSCFDMQDAALYRNYSTLFISAVCNRSENSQTYYKGYEWIERHKRFVKVDQINFLK